MEVSFIFITHNLGVTATVGGRVAVMYASKMVEMVSKEGIFSDPMYPYTQGLLRAVPQGRVWIRPSSFSPPRRGGRLEVFYED